MQRSNSNPTTSLTKRRSFRGWLKRVTLPNGSQRKVGPDNMPKGGVFGIPLVMSIKYAKTTVGYIDEDNIKHTKAGAIPIIVAKCGSFLKKNALDVEGIFRISGSAKRVNALEFQFDQSTSSYGLDLNWEGYTVHDAASLFRRYLNRLPDPVIPFQYYQQFRDVMSSNPPKDTEQRIELFQKLIQSLEPAHQHLLLYLLDFLNLFATAEAETKMDIPNLAAVFSPGILRHPDHNTPIQYKISQHVIEFLIEFQKLFTMQLLVPSRVKKTASSIVPPVPLLLPSSVGNQLSPPPVPLHVANPSAPSIKSSLAPSSIDNNSFIDSPLEITQQRNVQSQPQPQQTNDLGDKLIRLATPYYRILRQKITELGLYVEPIVAKPIALLACFSILFVTVAVVIYELYLAATLVSFEPLMFFTGLASYWGLLYHNEEPSSSSSASIFAADNDSVMSRSSRFNEEEDFAPPSDGSSSSDEDEDLGFDPATLEAYFTQYDKEKTDQIKRDAELAQKLQIEEQKARDENNPFVVETMAVGKAPIDAFDDDKVTTPTDKEAWKIRVFRDQ
ncbi:Rho GTPase activation protein [Mucor mucedo]|uniref:Rho GTPase activation protein n=1 Tax=Mucor mucedo TaxID=29922 RepID=UPI0022206AC5|nr:Rho GTPase activation protein [Mucor mucedo]KAI7882797.1 Rho GTPase activation protein [Mucor mucedo]